MQYASGLSELYSRNSEGVKCRLFANFDGRDSTPRPDTASLISQVNRGFLQAVQLHSCKNCKNVLASVPSAGVRPALDFYILARRVKQQLPCLLHWQHQF